MSPAMTAAGVCSCVFLLLVAGRARVASSQPPLPVRDLLPRYSIHPPTNPIFNDCRFTGRQPISVRWTREGTRLPSHSSNGPYYTTEGALILSRTTSSDSGNYTCIGSNSVGNRSISTIITITESPESPVGRRWWMIFVYALLLWLVLSSIISLWVFWKKRQSKSTNPAHVDRNEVFAIDHDGTTESRPHSRISGEFTISPPPVSGLGYPNPAYTWHGPGQHDQSRDEVVEHSRDSVGNQVTTRTIKSTSKEYFYIPPNASRSQSDEVLVDVSLPGATTSTIKKSKRPGSSDAKLQLLEEDDIIPSPH